MLNFVRTTETNSQLDWPLQLDELHSTLQCMQGRRAPGVSGLTVELTFWDILPHYMVSNERLASCSLPLPCRRTVVTLLPRKATCSKSKTCIDIGLLSFDQ